MLSQIVSILQIAVMIVCPVCCTGGICPAEQCCAPALYFSKSSGPGQSSNAQRCSSDSSDTALPSCCSDCGNGTEKTQGQSEKSQTEDLLESKLANSNRLLETTCPIESCPRSPYSEQSCQCICGGALSEKSVDRSVDSESLPYGASDVDRLGPSLFARQRAQSRSRAAPYFHQTQSGNTGRAARILLRSFLI